MEGECYGCGDDNPISLGLTFSREGDVCVATFKPRLQHRGVPGYLHGGVSSTVLDETMASVGFMLDNVHCVTATLNFKFRVPVPLTDDVTTSVGLRIEAWRQARDDLQPKRRHRVFGRLLLPDGSIAVEAEGIFISVPQGSLAWTPK